ncbi:phospho-sugar mutase [Leucobacter sp. W1478]|uniref:phospho-sugar mutase n=1 Tax=Leucobacter sp. W1478 TaxID=3439065 RepID=UPI003F35E4A4
MSEADFGALVSEITQWIANDPDPATRAEAQLLLTQAGQGNPGAKEQLQSAFGGRLKFGTAGLRAEIGAGPRRMNRVVVSQTSAGFAEFLQQRARAGKTSTPPSVVVGYDGRVNSEIFARDVAEIMAGAGIRVVLLPEPLPTPVVAFAVRHLQVSAGVMITASHNPPRDNGYKVYLGDEDEGSQIAPPNDAEIAALIDERGALPCAELPRSTGYTVAGPELVDAYVARTADALKSGFHAPLPAKTPTIVYTAMHGVGSTTTRRVFTAAGLPAMIPVTLQDRPDSTFPTVSFPNPEEEGALDLAYETARGCSADLIIANDPDADRLAIAAPHSDEASGYRRLTGNELGILLGWRAAERARRAAQSAGQPLAGTLANTIVSSPALSSIAHSYGLDHVETLSGFKWVSRVPNLVFGFEEALGYLTHPSVVHDKDGISAAAEACAMACELHAEGRTVWHLLDEASERFGHYASAQVVVRLDSPQAVAALAERVRNAPAAHFGGTEVSRLRDFRDPGHSTVPANVLAYDLADGSRVMIRPSGTEPKLKAYLDVVCTEGTANERRITAAATLRRLDSGLRAYLREVGE